MQKQFSELAAAYVFVEEKNIDKISPTQFFILWIITSI